jgi:hypothetical protein
MKRTRSRLERRLLSVFAAFGLGLAMVVVGVAALDSRLVVGVSLIWILAVLFYALRAFRCPLCGAALLYYPLGAALRWLRASPRLCPRCRTDYDAALTELGRGSRRST